MTIGVMIVDEHSIVRAGLRVMLEAAEDCSVVGEAETASCAVGLAACLKPDVILMEVRMSTGDAVSTLAKIVSTDRPPKVIVLTNVEVAECVIDTLRAGASGFILKRSSAERIIDAVRTVYQGGMPLDPLITRQLMDSYLRLHLVPPVGSTRSLCDLSEREGEIVELLVRGMSTNEVAATLALCRTTVKTHISHVLTKWDLRDRVQLVARAYETGFVQNQRRIAR